MKLIFLGIGGTLPTKDRNLSSVAVEIGKIRFLLDCGEGTQKQLMRSNFSYMKLNAIFISHFHGDHILGIPGLLQTLSLNNRQKDLYIIGPPGTVKLLEAMEEISFYSRSFPLQVAELSPGENFTLFDVKIETIQSRHSLPGLIYKLVEPTPERVLNRTAIRKYAEKRGVSPGELYREYAEKMKSGVDVGREFLGTPRPGRVLIYTGDTAYFEDLLTFSKGADVLISEATFPSEMGERAMEWGHMTVAQAASLGREADVRYLFLVHLSPRIKGEEGVEEVRREANAIFPGAIVPEELVEYVIKKRR